MTDGQSWLCEMLEDQDKLPITFHVDGNPSAQGSMEGFVFKTKSGKSRVALTHVSGRKLMNWRHRVAQAAILEYDGEPWEGPAALCVTFRFARPLGHYRSRNRTRPLRDDAPPVDRCDSNLDLDKLVRAVGDALTGVIWRDDKQITYISATKEWGEPGATVKVFLL